jgi:3-oxoadipate enol-lactonase
MAYVRTRLGRWFYEERGTAKREGDPPIILLHSLLCDGGMWKKQIEPLSALGRVINIDGPGHGKSEAPPRFTLEDHAEALAIDAFNELKISKAILVGLSWGGMVSMRAAIQDPMRVVACALIDTSAAPEPLANKVRYRAMIAFAKRYGIPPWLVEHELGPAFFCDKTLREHPEYPEQLARTANGFSREGLARASLAVMVHRSDARPRLRSVAAPTLVLHGRGDRALPPHNGSELASKIHNARLEIIEDAGHLACIEQPAAVNAQLVPFLKVHLAKR